MTKTICLDAGHGLTTPGKRTPKGVREWTLNDAVCRYTASFLSDYDVCRYPQSKQAHKHYNAQFDIQVFIQKYLRVSKMVNVGDYTKYLLEECPFDNSHKSPDSMITVSTSGAIGFKCLHDSCTAKKWEDVRVQINKMAVQLKSKTNN